MSKRANLWAKRLMATSMCTAFVMPGCNFSLDDAMLQSLLNSPLADGDFEFKFEFESDGQGGDFDDDSHHGSHDDSDDEPGDDNSAG